MAGKEREKPIVEARRRIEQARQRADTTVSLGLRGLTVLPPAIGKLKQLQELAVWGNNLSVLPAAIGELKELRQLLAWDNQLTALPAAIGELKQLQTLSVSSNQLMGLPPRIGELKHLHRLNVSSNRLTALPRAIGELIRLRELDLGSNRLTALPAAIGKLKQLQTLHAPDNELTALPAGVGELKQLKTLDLRNNKLATLPESLAGLPKLEELCLHDNEGLGIPPEILGPERSQAKYNKQPAKPADILAFYFKSRKEATRRLNEAKILLVGQGGVGKTSLVNRLVRDKYDPHEEKTEGIAIERWELPGQGADGDEPEPICLNIWDFGGQEIMHATHQFFLTKRSLYLVLIDARQGEIEGNIHYWLRIIQSYGGDAPVLIVTNKIDASHYDLNETRLKKDFAPNVKGFFKISCVTGEGISNLREAIETQVSALPHLRDRLPVSYFAIKEQLEADANANDYIDTADYRKVCVAYGAKDKGEQDRLLRFLHDLGGVLNFDDPDNPLSIRDTKILNPKWVTNGVYKILNDVGLAISSGELDLTRLDMILLAKDGYPCQCHGFIIGMMGKFDLCFEFPDSKGKRLLIPELLPKNEPDLGWDTREALNFQYHYSVLPGGLISRFIVKMHHNLTHKPTYWRSGVLLVIEGNRCLVRADVENERVYVSVTGPSKGRRQALSVIRNAFKGIHDSIPKLDAVQKVPLPDNPKVVVDYEHLVTLEEKKIAALVPEGTKEEYEVADLLDGIEKRKERRARLAQEAQRRRTGKQARRGEVEPEHHDPHVPTWQRIAAAAVGLVFMCVIVGIAFAIPDPTDFQLDVFQVVLALAAAGVSALIPGLVKVQVKGWVTGFGAMAVFVLVYTYNPPARVANQGANTPAKATTPAQLGGEALTPARPDGEAVTPAQADGELGTAVHSD